MSSEHKTPAKKGYLVNVSTGSDWVYALVDLLQRRGIEVKELKHEETDGNNWTGLLWYSFYNPKIKKTIKINQDSKDIAVDELLYDIVKLARIDVDAKLLGEPTQSGPWKVAIYNE
jgi:hypothetical protein